MDHIIIDLETLGTNQDSAFIAIGACQFDPDTGAIGETFYENIDWNDSLKTRKVSGDTIKWWMRQSKEAQDRVCAPGKPLRDVLKQFGVWVRMEGAERKVWGNGATFDISMLENAYMSQFGITPWKYWNVRDVRTIVELSNGIINKEDVPFEGTPHYALDDALHQAKYVSAMWRGLRK